MRATLGDLVFSVGASAYCASRSTHAGEGVGDLRVRAIPRLHFGRGQLRSGVATSPLSSMRLDRIRDRLQPEHSTPYCAYTDAFECPFPRAENDLPGRHPGRGEGLVDRTQSVDPEHGRDGTAPRAAERSRSKSCGLHTFSADRAALAQKTSRGRVQGNSKAPAVKKSVARASDPLEGEGLKVASADAATAG